MDKARVSPLPFKEKNGVKNPLIPTDRCYLP
jgi:hypothetical protein